MIHFYSISVEMKVVELRCLLFVKCQDKTSTMKIDFSFNLDLWQIIESHSIEIYSKIIKPVIIENIDLRLSTSSSFSLSHGLRVQNNRNG